MPNFHCELRVARVVAVFLACLGVGAGQAQAGAADANRHLLVVITVDNQAFRIGSVTVVPEPLPKHRAQPKIPAMAWEYGLADDGVARTAVGMLADPTWLHGDVPGSASNSLRPVHLKRQGPTSFAIRLPYRASGQLWLRAVTTPQTSNKLNEPLLALLPFELTGAPR